MTNEDIATKFHDEVESFKGHTCYHHLGTYSDGVYNGALDMADWKDNQLKQLLSEHMEHATGQRLEAFMDLYRELFEQNAPEIPQATRLSTTQPSNIADTLFTPRELCKDCYNWCTQEDVGPYDFPHCGEGFHPETHNYLIGLSSTCPEHLVQ